MAKFKVMSKAFKNVLKEGSEELGENFAKKATKLNGKEITGMVNKTSSAPSKLVKEFKKVTEEAAEASSDFVEKTATLKNGSKVTGSVRGEGVSKLKNYIGKTPFEGRGQKYNSIGKTGKTAEYMKDGKYHTDFVRNNTTAYKTPGKDAPKLGSFENQKRYTSKDMEGLNNLKNETRPKTKEESLLRKAVPTAVGGAMIFTMMNRRGQQSNSQLYGQQTPYQ